MHQQSLMLLQSLVREKMHLQENTLFVAQYPLHHVTISATKFEVATSNDLGGDTFSRNVTNGATDRLWYEINSLFFFSGYNKGLKDKDKG